MVLVTLVGERQAKPGYEFIYNGSLPDCKDCKLKTVCFNLVEGRKYRVKDVRSIHHDCQIHEEGVRVVEVDAVPLEIAIPDRMALEGAVITLDEQTCNNLGCEKEDLCTRHGLKVGLKYKVAEVGEDVQCPEGRKMKRVRLE